MSFFSSLPLTLQRIICSLYVYPALLVDFVVSFLIQAVYIVLSFPFVTCEQRADHCGHIFRYVSYLIIDRFNPFWHCHVLNSFPRGWNKEANLPTKKIILMLNHISSADPFLSIRAFLPRDGTWVSKAVLFSVPFGGWSMGNSDDLPVYFLDKHKHSASAPLPAQKQTGAGGEEEDEMTSNFVNSFAVIPGTVGPMLERARAKLRRGRMLCVFPEGTRSEHADRPNYLEPFRQGFFDLAMEEGAYIVPLAITGTNRAWPRGSVLMQPANCYFSFGNVVEAARFSDARELSAVIRRELMSLRENHPDRRGTAPL